MTLDLKALAASAPRYPRIEELKELPILYVLELAGHTFTEKTEGVYSTTSPFRDDRNPSFDVFGEHLERWGDFAEGTSGDVIDLLGRFIKHHTGVQPAMGEVKDEAARLLGKYRSSGWAGPTTGAQRSKFDLEAAKRYVDAVLDSTPATPQWFGWQAARNDRLAEIPTDWLVNRFSLGYDGENLMIPYFDADGHVIAYKTRNPAGGPTVAAAGSDGPWAGVLYGQWLDTDPSRTVVLCEGESDVWSGTHAAPPGYVFLGLPTGAGAPPTQASLLAGRRVILAFDGDPSGRGATVRWTDALVAERADLLIAYVPDGKDLTSLSATECVAVVESALPVRPMPSDAFDKIDNDAGYEKPYGKGTLQVSDWTFRPEQVLVGSTGVSWYGELRPHGKHVTLRSFDLSSKAKIVEWSQAQGCTWMGSDRDAQVLASTFHAQSTFLPRGTSVSVTGLHHDIIVYPGGRIGDANFVYVPGKAAIPIDSMVRLEESRRQEPFHYAALIEALRELHGHQVMDPILAWLAIAPLRSRFQQFPILAVSGGSGTGKTTLVREVVRHFTATSISANLTGTTKFAILGYLGSTNAFPVWFDEFRPGARKDTMAEFAQLLRDAYTGQASIKGGLGDHWSSVSALPVGAPIIVSGEDSFSETSHTERMVQVHLPRDGKNIELMTRLLATPTTSFAHAYYDFIRTAATPEIVPEGPGHLPDRLRYNLGVLRAGWRLLEDFAYGYSDETLGEPGWDLIIAEAEESAQSNPILDAIRWALEEPSLAQDRVVFVTGDKVAVRPVSLVAAVNKTGTFVLPGGPRAVAKYLKSHLRGENSTLWVERLGEKTAIRAWTIPLSLISSSSDAE